MKNKEKTLNLLNQILGVAAHEDKRHKEHMLMTGKGSKAIGDSWMVFHLKELRELIEKD